MEATRVVRTNNDHKKAKPAGLTYRIHAPNSAWHNAAPIEEARTLDAAAAGQEHAERGAPIRPRMGWSLAIASGANIILGSAAIATGATAVGIVACSGLSIATCGLVLAEISWRYRLDPYESMAEDDIQADR